MKVRRPGTAPVVRPGPPEFPLGGFHWGAARLWRRVRGFITGGLGVALLFACPTACGPAPATDPWPAEAWPTATPEAQGLDAAVLSRLDDELRAGEHGFVDGLLVIRNGLVVHEASFTRDYDTPFKKITQPPGPYNYYDPEWHPYYRRGRLHTLQSVSKSVTSALIGIAIRRGEIPGVGVRVLPYFDGFPIKNLDDRKKAITLEDLLTMRSGLEWDEWSTDYTSPANSCSVMEGLDDWVGYVLDRPMAHRPGEVFTYSSGVTMLLVHILQAATGKDAEDYAREHLFGPLGIREHYWKRTPKGIPDAEGGLYFTASDLARIGYLYLHGGVWDGRRILPDDWVARSISPIVAATSTGIEGFGYGYQWWAGRQSYAASGYGGQRLFVVPGRNLIAVYTGWNIYHDPSLDPVMALDRVLEAVRTPLQK